MGSATGALNWTDGVTKHLDAMERAAPGVIGMVVRKHTADAEAYMKSNAPWQDDTGNARNSLVAVAETNHPDYVITLIHGADYGIWLEVANSGRFEIIRPTVEHEGAALIESMALVWALLLRGQGAT